ncbi:MAG: type IV pilin protein [Pseudomonadota bacterium]
MQPRRRRRCGFTLTEILTVLIVIAVLVAVAVPMWRTHQLRVHRADGCAALIAAQTAQDKFFGTHARYADGAEIAAPAPAGLGVKPLSVNGFYRIEIKASTDGLAYLATARATDTQGQASDSRCVEFSLDHNGRRRAVDSTGEDRSADCWR